MSAIKDIVSDIPCQFVGITSPGDVFDADEGVRATPAGILSLGYVQIHSDRPRRPSKNCRIDSGPAIKDIIPSSTVQRIVARAAKQRIISLCAIQGVVSRTAIQRISSGLTCQTIIACPPKQFIISTIRA
nr:hypothetical protein [Desulfolutivibrio sulfoxidireducens]